MRLVRQSVHGQLHSPWREAGQSDTCEVAQFMIHVARVFLLGEPTPWASKQLPCLIRVGLTQDLRFSSQYLH